MIEFPIEINGTSVMSSEIFPFVRNYQTKKAVEYLIQKTGCSNEEAMDAINDLREFTLSHRNNSKTDFNKHKIKNIENQIKDNVLKCPTCGSTRIQKISASKKMMGAFGFGLLSKTAKSQFECKNCGYKW